MALSFAQDTGRVARLRVSARAVAPFAVAAAIYGLLLILGGRLLNDADTFWQIALGDWMRAQGRVPQADTFSFTMNGAPWISSQWLAQVLYAKVFAGAGFAGVVAVASGAIALSFGLLAYFLLQRLAVTPALVLTVTGFVLASPHLLARPHALALPVMVAWVAGLIRAADENRAPSLWMLPLMTLWANLHGGFTLGFLFISVCALDVFVRSPSQDRVAVLLRWGGFGALAIVAACMTPYGYESVLVTRRILGLGDALALIGEWKPQDFAKLGGFELILLAAIGFAVHRGIKLPPIRILILLGLLHMALSQSRNCEVLGLIAPLVIAAPLAAQIGRRDESDRPRGGAILAAVVALVCLSAATAVAASTIRYQPSAHIMPAHAVDAIKANGAQRVFNDYDFGGYLISRGVAPFIDGRTELYGETFVIRHHRAVRLEDVADFFRLLDEYKIDATLLNPATPAAGLLDRMDGWTRIYADEFSVVHRRSRNPGAVR
jgi:hypothetical protein